MYDTLREIKEICEKAERGTITPESAMEQISRLTNRYKDK